MVVISEALGKCMGVRARSSANNLPIVVNLLRDSKTRPTSGLWKELLQFLSRKIIEDTDSRTVFTFQALRPSGNRWNWALSAWQKSTQNRGFLRRSAHIAGEHTTPATSRSPCLQIFVLIFHICRNYCGIIDFGLSQCMRKSVARLLHRITAVEELLIDGAEVWPSAQMVRLWQQDLDALAGNRCQPVKHCNRWTWHKKIIKDGNK